MTWTDINDPTGYQRRKEERRVRYAKYVHGWKEIPCTACNGSGYYDNNGSPKCGSCDGTGTEKVSPAQYKIHMEIERRCKAQEERWKILPS
jgi:RecJ-like exonuclease